MRKFKKFIKKYLSSFAYFYGYLRNKIFIALGLSVAVSALDSIGLSMFVPLFKVLAGEEISFDSDNMGRFGDFIEKFLNLGVNLNLWTVLGLMLVIFSLKGLANYLHSAYNIILRQSFIRKVRLDLLNKLNNLSFKFFINSDVGRIQNTMSGEVDRVSEAFRTYFQAIQKGIMVCVYLGFAFMLDAKFTGVVTIIGALTYFIYRLIYRRTKESSRELTGHSNVFQGEIIQHVGNYKYLKATAMISTYAEKLKETIYKIEASRRRMGLLVSLSLAIREPLTVLIIAIVIIAQVKLFGMTMGAIIFTLLVFYRALTTLVSLQENWNNFMQVSGSLENMQDFQKELSLGKQKDGSVEITEFNKKIVLENVSFSYGESTVLKGIDLTIDKNSSMAFVGESGSGKTTLVNLLAGLFTEENGSIFVDDIPLKDIKKETYQKRIGYVTQDPVIFNDTIYNNITFWAPETPENITRFEQCLKQASLNEFIGTLPEGKDTELGHNGINLSGGQKQRVSIARELFKDIDILILDEATSALDTETEKTIQESIEALQGKYTLLIIAHRLSTIRNTDCIVLLDKGRILGKDNFDSLVRQQPKFKKMVELQDLN